MNEKDQELLLIDLCARLPYGVKIRVNYPFYEEKDLHPEDLYGLDLKMMVISGTSIRIEEFKPYLRSLSENMMSESEAIYYNTVFTVSKHHEKVDWLNEHMFDYRGLIGKGLVLEAPEGMYKF